MRKDKGGDIIAETIYKKVRTFVQSGRIPKRDADDFAQDLYLRVLTRMRKSLAECREQNYINRIVHQQAINLLRYQYCGKRHTCKKESFAEWKISIASEQELHDLRIDCANILRRLPVDAKRLASELMAGTALAQLANKLGLANSTLRYMLNQLGEDFHILKDER